MASMASMTAGLGKCANMNTSGLERRRAALSKRNARFAAGVLGLVGYAAFSLGGGNDLPSDAIDTTLLGTRDVYAKYMTKSKTYERPRAYSGSALHRLLCADGQEDRTAKESGLGLFSSAAVFSLGRRFLTCETYALDEDLIYPPADNPEDPTGTAADGAVPGSSAPGGDPGSEDFEQNVAYVVTLASCPEDSTQPALLREQDPGSDAFYDAAAVLQHGVCQCSAENPDSGSSYNHTVYAIVHPDAVNCLAPESSPSRRLAKYRHDGDGDGERNLQGGDVYYNRVSMLQDLGYWVKIYDNPVDVTELTEAANPHLKANVESDAGIRDLMKLHAYRLTGHSLAVVMSFDAVMRQPMDGVLDAFKSASSGALYSTDVSTAGLDDDILVVKPDEAEYEAIKTAYKSTTYDATTGWNGQGEGLFSGGMGIKGFMKHYYKNVKGAGAAEETTLKGSSVSSFDPTCGKPWECKYDDLWSAAQKSSCTTQNSEWYSYRYDFEQNWNKIPDIDLSVSQYHRDNFLGYCSGDASEGGYTGIIQSVPPPPTTTTTTTVATTTTTTTPAYDACAQTDQTKYNICLDFKKSPGVSYSNGDWTQHVSSGAARWESVISGDLPGTFNLDRLSNYPDHDCGSAPTSVDDIYICAKDPVIDGPYKVLGSAGPLLGAFFHGGTKVLPISGMMRFDSADIDMMMGGPNPTWAEVVTHEIGHILGVGSLWDNTQWGHDLVHTSSLPFHYKDSNSNACQKWREITGCSLGGSDECPPIEEDGGGGTAGGHWDEAVMPTELMSGYVGDGTSALSVITVGCLEDLGYSVDYTKADSYTLACPSGRRRLQEDDGTKLFEDNVNEQTKQPQQGTSRTNVRVRPVASFNSDGTAVRRLSSVVAPQFARRRLSEQSIADAVNYANAELDKAAAVKAEAEAAFNTDNPDAQVVYLADHFISVFVADPDGTIASVDVTRETTGTP